MNRRRPLGMSRRLAWLVLGVVAALGVSGWAALAEKPVREDRMLRQIGVMEGIIDKLLLDSPNFLVSVGHNTRGLYIPEYGAVFTFQASLTQGKTAIEAYLKQLGNRFEIKTDENGDQVVITKPGKPSKKDLVEDLPELLADSESDEVGSKLYEAGKDELMQVILDYGETMSQLRGGQWIVIAAFLDKSQFLKANNLSRLILKVKIDDLRDFSAGKLNEKEMESRIQVEEF